ncbi:MAG: bile acid:sodium symporter [Planctomycetales bacterium]|nr:bile acid:sodium symporter [Planctomycetales bacterium]
MREYSVRDTPLGGYGFPGERQLRDPGQTAMIGFHEQATNGTGRVLEKIIRHENTRLARMVRVIQRVFVWLVLAAYVSAALFPSPGMWIRYVHFGHLTVLGVQLKVTLPLLMLAFLLFNAGVGTRVSELPGLVRHPSVLVLGVLGVVAIPLALVFAVALMGQWWTEPNEVQQLLVGLSVLAAMPIAGASPAWSQNSNGNLTLSLGLLLVSTILSPLATPLVLRAVQCETTGSYARALGHVAGGRTQLLLCVYVILPVVAGILVRTSVGTSRTLVVRPYLKSINFVLLLLLAYANASICLPKTLAKPDFDFIFPVLAISTLLCAVSFACAFGLAKMVRAERANGISLLFGIGMRNTSAGLVLASIMLERLPQVLLPIIFYSLLQNVVAAVTSNLLQRKDKSAVATS